MMRIVHLSDLHFGRSRDVLVGPLLERVNGMAPDLVAISGDLTQRARSAQFRAARAFLRALSPPVLCVPGNHDIPLHDPVRRLLDPFRDYRAWISDALEPVFRAKGVTVVGVNTVNPRVWQSGRIGGSAVRRVCTALGHEHGAVGVVVAHHPFEQDAGAVKRPMRGADAALDRLAACGADIVLTGHLHTWRVAPFAERKGRRGAIQVQAGTSLSTRQRGEENDFNLLTIERTGLTVERFAADADTHRFEPVRSVRFDLRTRNHPRHR